MTVDVSHLHSTVDIEYLIDWLQIQTEAGKHAFRTKCSSWQTEIETLKSISYQFASVKQALIEKDNTITSLLECIAKIEPDILTLCQKTSDLEKESTSELLFLHPILTPLNFVPYLLLLWSYIRVYILPGLSLLMPILMCILPYIFIRFVFNIPISVDRYLAMIVCMFAGDTSVLLQPEFTLSFYDIVDTFTKSLLDSPIKAVSKVAGIGVTVGQSVIQPYLTFQHLHSVHTILTKKTNTLEQFISYYSALEQELLSRGMEMPKSPFPKVSGTREHVAHAILDPMPYRVALDTIGRIEALIRVASKSECSPVFWKSDDKSVHFELRDTFDIHVDAEKRKLFSVNLSDSKSHALLTGPNRGGKSTALRAMCVSALLAHTYGCVLGKPVHMTPFSYMFASLSAEDIPGSKSHFEREVDFVAKTLHTDGPTLVFIDELFHTTNPPDALESCKVYCKDLWKNKTIVSVISTHLFDLVDKALDTHVQTLCCPATLKPDFTVNYEYGLQKGTCKVSSVYEILFKYGFYIESAVEEEMKKSQEGQK